MVRQTYVAFAAVGNSDLISLAKTSRPMYSQTCCTLHEQLAELLYAHNVATLCCVLPISTPKQT